MATRKTTFILKHLLILFLPFAVLMVVFLLVDIFVFNDSLVDILKSSFIFWPFAFPVMEIIALISAQKRAKKIGVELWAEEHESGNLKHQLNVNDTKEGIIEKLSLGNWKYKIVDEKIHDDKTILLLKHYQVPTNAAIFIELSDTNQGQSKVTFRTHSERKSKWSLLFTNWTLQLKQIEYFQNVILSQEKLNAKLSLLD